MPTKLMVIRANDFIKATAQGTLTFVEAREALLDIAKTANTLTDYDILLDTRKTKSLLSTTDIYCLAAELVRLRAAFGHRVAVLCPPDRFEDAKFFENCTLNRGLDVRGFTSFEDAMTWLTEEPDYVEETTTVPT